MHLGYGFIWPSWGRSPNDKVIVNYSRHLYLLLRKNEDGLAGVNVIETVKESGPAWVKHLQTVYTKELGLR